MLYAFSVVLCYFLHHLSVHLQFCVWTIILLLIQKFANYLPQIIPILQAPCDVKKWTFYGMNVLATVRTPKNNFLIK